MFGLLPDRVLMPGFQARIFEFANFENKFEVRDNGWLRGVGGGEGGREKEREWGVGDWEGERENECVCVCE